MTASATPTKNDPKNVDPFQFTASNATYYTAPAERGVRIFQILVVNDTTTNVTVTIYCVPSAGTAGDDNILCKTMTVPADGCAVVVPGSVGKVLEPSATIQGLASVTLQVTCHIDLMEMAA